MKPLLFLLVFAPYVKIGGSSFPIGYFGYLLAFFLYFIKQPLAVLQYKKNSTISAIIFFSFICLFTIWLNTARRGEIDTKLLRLIVDPLVIYLASKLFFYYFLVQEKGGGAKGLLFCLTAFNCINALAIYLCFMSENFLSHFYSIVQVNPKLFEYPIPRYSGFLYDGFSYSSTLMALLTITCHQLHTNLKKRSKSGLLVLLHLFALPASLLAGRTGLVILAVYFLFIAIFNAKYLTKAIFKPKFLLTLVASVLSITGILVLLHGLDGPIGEYFRYSSRFITTLFDDSGYTDYTTSELAENHYFLPENTLSIFIGEGYLIDWPSNIARPDPAVTLGVFAFGFLGFFAYACVLFSPLVVNFPRRNILPYLSNHILLLLVFGILMVKDAYIFYPYPHFFLFFLITKIISIRFKAI